MNRSFDISKNKIQFFFISSTFILTFMLTFSTSYIKKLTAAPEFFYGMTIALLALYILISITIILKYLSDKKCLFLIPIACAFVGSAIVMALALRNYPEVFTCGITSSIKYNEFLFYYFHRNALTIFQIIAAAFLFRFRSHKYLASHNHIIVTFICVSVTIAVILVVWNSAEKPLDPILNFAINNINNVLTTWQTTTTKVMILSWGITFLISMTLTRFRNIFWIGIYFYCIFYILTMVQLLSTHYATDSVWYQARLFETLCTLVFIIVIFLNVFKLHQISNNKYEDAYQNSIRDYLTQLFNRRFFHNELTKKIRHTSKKNPLSLIVCDIDHFKRINDNYGHHQGDIVIQYVSWMLQDLVRKVDIVARTGGEEFALLLNNTHQQQAVIIAERIRLAISTNRGVSNRVRLPESITISMGIFTIDDARMGGDECLRRADKALYQAKEEGRNRVIVWKGAEINE